ncbi:hypothetical protein [Variovorax sp. WDL1]|uniref:hypothetical protein n=1 Tax=Variovorax sp. WDL1 TaxID=207745 RepID=UPI001E423DFC|nr:hypothetical protein [Variovorax sp. WDL1]
MRSHAPDHSGGRWKAGFAKAQEVIRAELPLVERELQLIAANTIDLTEHAGWAGDQAYLRGRLYGEACKSDHLDEPLIRRVIEFFG